MMGNVGYISEEIHISNTLRFWIKMWCLSLVWSRNKKIIVES